MNYVISNDKTSVVISSLGAEMRSISTPRGIQYLWAGNPEFWSDSSPLLFPYVGRLTNGQYRYNGVNYPMDIHGFARRMEFSVHDRSRYSIELMLMDTKETFEIYPFHFILKVKYTLTGNAIQIRYQVENTSDYTMYYGIGSHPGFNVPMEDGLDFSDYYLEFSERHIPSRVGHTEDYFLSGCDTEFILEDQNKLRLDHSLFDDDVIVLKHVADGVTLKSDKSAHSVTVTYRDMPYLGIWHAPRTKAPYLCLEAWTSLPSRQGVVEDLRFKSDLIRLSPRGTYVNQWEITIE